VHTECLLDLLPELLCQHVAGIDAQDARNSRVLRKQTLMERPGEGHTIESLATNLCKHTLDQRFRLQCHMTVRAGMADDHRATAVDDPHEARVLQPLIGLPDQHASNPQLVLEGANGRQQVSWSQLAQREGDFHLLLDLHGRRNSRTGIEMEQSASSPGYLTVTIS
jgi:hypothetical protein